MLEPTRMPSESAQGVLPRVLGVFSIVTMLATIPQVIDVWSVSDISGVSLISWIAYLMSACLWLVYGIQRRDRSIYLACIGWIALDAAVVVGIIIRQS